MSYDIGFFAADGAQLPSIEALDAFVRSRPHYQVEGGTARYWNPATAVGFDIDYGDHRDEEGWDPIRLGARISGTHTRALEKGEEIALRNVRFRQSPRIVAAVVEGLEKTADSPQDDR